MISYSYKALTPAGDVVAGTLKAANEPDLRKQIEARGMIAVEVKTESALQTARQFDWRALFKNRATGKDVTQFLQQLAALLQASIRLDHALELLGHKELAGTLAEQVYELRRAILSGEALSVAMSRYNDLFPASMRAMISLSEQSGTLPDTMKAIANERERTERLKQKAVDALTYPAFLLTAVAAVLVFFVTFVLPQFRPIIADLGQKADPVLMVLLDLAAFLELHRIEMFGLATLVLLALFVVFRDVNRRRAFTSTLLRAWGLRGIARDYTTARFCRNFGHLVERGISLTEAIDLAGKAVATPLTGARFAKARDEVRQGQRVFDALERTEALSPVALRMLRIGEETGRMPMIALKAADMFETRVERQMEKLVGLIGPIAIIIVSVIVGGLIVSVMTALMSINQIIG